MLPSDNWFLEAAHKAIGHLTKNENEMSIVQDPVAEFPVLQELVAEEIEI